MGLLDILNAASGAALQGANTYQQMQTQQETRQRQARQDALDRADLAMKLGDGKGLMGALQASGLNVDPTTYLQQQQESHRAQIASRNSEMLGKLSTAVKAGTLDPARAERIYRQYDAAYRGAVPLFAKPGPAPLTEAQRIAHEDRQAALAQSADLARMHMSLAQSMHADSMAHRGEGRAKTRLVQNPDGTWVEVQAGDKTAPPSKTAKKFDSAAAMREAELEAAQATGVDPKKPLGDKTAFYKAKAEIYAQKKRQAAQPAGAKSAADAFFEQLSKMK
jgi:hypothetical protein